MQQASDAYKKSIKQPIRNRAYIRATIGLINQEAQKTAKIKQEDNKLAYFTDSDNVFNGCNVTRIYATAEQDFSKVDGTMYFLPYKDSNMKYYYNGIVSNSLKGAFIIDFEKSAGLDIKGLSIDFGSEYPTLFLIQWDEGELEFQNNNNFFTTEHIFANTTWMKIIAEQMKSDNTRFRMYEITFGIAKTFGNDSVLKYSFSDYVSPISETIPSQDMVLEIDNQNLYYSVDNPDSAFAFLEVGQEIRVSFGYDTGDEGIEWIHENTCYLNTWKADDTKARFTASDIFDFVEGYYYKGAYRADGITLYDLAADVLQDAGIYEDQYFLDLCLKKIVVHNPMPTVKHVEALQIIANAGRCILYQDRSKRICIKSDFIPDMSVSTNGVTEYSNTEELLKNTSKDAYAIQSNDFSIVDGSIYFIPQNENYKKIGYVSNCIADSDGNFEENPQITINAEIAFNAYGLIINFRNVPPEEFIITTYNQGEMLKKFKVNNPAEYWFTEEVFENFNEMKIEFSKGHPNSRITIDNILVSDVTDYVLERNVDIYGNPTGERKAKVKTISVLHSVYKMNNEEMEIVSEKIVLSDKVTRQTLYFSEAYYDLNVNVDSAYVIANIVECSNYMAVLEFEKLSNSNIEISFSVSGKKYNINKYPVLKKYNPYGQEIIWENPLISDAIHAAKIRDWIAVCLTGDVEYEIYWRGDPRIDAGDLMYLELKDRKLALIKTYQNILNYNGAWDCTSKSRKAVVKWQ